MKTVTLVAFNRPQYTREVLESLRANRTAGYSLVIAVEPGCPETLSICRAVSFMPTEVIVNPRRLGVNWNNRRLYDLVFARGSQGNVALEDDTPLASDALDLAEWYWNCPQRDHYVLMNFFNHSHDATRPLEVLECDTFCPWAWCCTQEMYKRWIRPAWMCDTRGWDYSICAMMRQCGFKALHPALSRSRNTGRLNGAHCTPEYHDQCFRGHVASMGGYGNSFRITG